MWSVNSFSLSEAKLHLRKLQCHDGGSYASWALHRFWYCNGNVGFWFSFLLNAMICHSAARSGSFSPPAAHSKINISSPSTSSLPLASNRHASPRSRWPQQRPSFCASASPEHMTACLCSTGLLALFRKSGTASPTPSITAASSPLVWDILLVTQLCRASFRCSLPKFLRRPLPATIAVAKPLVH